MTNVASFLKPVPRITWGIYAGDRRMMVSSGKSAWAKKHYAKAALLNHMRHAAGVLPIMDYQPIVDDSLEKGYVRIVPLHRVVLNVGDWSGDGSGASFDVPILCNRTGEEIEAAYRRAVEMVGFDLIDQCADLGSLMLADPDFEYEYAHDDHINIGGYGVVS